MGLRVLTDPSHHFGWGAVRAERANQTWPAFSPLIWLHYPIGTRLIELHSQFEVFPIVPRIAHVLILPLIEGAFNTAVHAVGTSGDMSEVSYGINLVDSDKAIFGKCQMKRSNELIIHFLEHLHYLFLTF